MNPAKLFIISLLMSIIPPTRGFSLKRKLYRWCGATIGEGVRIVSSAKIIGNGQLSIGDNTWIGHNVSIFCSSKIFIGKNCDIAPNVYIGTGTHKITPNKERIAGIDINKDINIEDGCWLCAGSYILPGITIGHNSVIAAGAIVTKDVEDYNLVAGNPAMLKKKLQ